MDIEQLLESIRNHYLEAYRGEIKSYKEKFSPGGPKVLLETEGDKQYVYRLYRIDLASGATDPPNLSEVNPDSYLNFETLKFNFSGMEIQFSPIHWNGVEFEISPPMKDDDILQQWALHWIDPEESATTDDHGLGNYVHSITQPETTKSKLSFSVDFGSSETRAFFQLLETLVKEGTKSVFIQSSSVIEAEDNDA